MNNKTIRIILQLIYIGFCSFGFVVADYITDNFGNENLSFPILTVLWQMYMFAFGIITLMISGFLQTYKIEYQKPKTRIAFLPQNYFVKKTIGLEFSKYDIGSKQAEDIVKKSDLEIAHSISTFCASKGSTANKMLITIAIFAFGEIMGNIQRFDNIWIQIRMAIIAFGLLIVGLSESKYHNYAWSHIVGLVIMFFGIITELYKNFGWLEIGIVIFAFILHLVFSHIMPKNKIVASLAILFEFIAIYYPTTIIFLRLAF